MAKFLLPVTVFATTTVDFSVSLHFSVILVTGVREKSMRCRNVIAKLDFYVLLEEIPVRGDYMFWSFLIF